MDTEKVLEAKSSSANENQAPMIKVRDEERDDPYPTTELARLYGKRHQIS